MSGEIIPFQLPIIGPGGIFEIGGPGAGFPRPDPGQAQRDIERQQQAIGGAIEQARINFDEVNKNLQAFSVGILGIGGLMGFALWLFLMGKGLSALGINLQDEEE